MKLRRPRTWRYAWAVPAGAALAGVLVLVTAGSGGAQRAIGYPVVDAHTGAVRTAQATLRAELRAERLTVVELACVKNGRTYEGHPIVRCNVDFGDPHVQAYCTVVSGNRMVTNYENPAIPCQPDWSGWKIISFSSSPKGT